VFLRFLFNLIYIESTQLIIFFTTMQQNNLHFDKSQHGRVCKVIYNSEHQCVDGGNNQFRTSWRKTQ
jgi:hypothetical protein